MEQPLISIIIPTINRYEDLQNTLNDLSKQSIQEFEIIIIDQTDKDKSKKIAGDKITHLHKNYKSASKARNEGLLIAKSSIILFLDDDVIIENRDFLKNHLKNYNNEPNLSGVFGCVLGLDKKIVSHLPKKVHNKHLGWMYFPKNYDKQFKIGNGISCNLSVQKKYALEIGGMDENFFKGAHREESDFCFRLSKKFGKLNYDPSTCLIHIGNPSGGIRSWDDSIGIIHSKQHMFGDWYFMFRHIPVFLYPIYSWKIIRRFILHKKLLKHFYFLPKALYRFISMFFLAVVKSIQTPKHLQYAG